MRRLLLCGLSALTLAGCYSEERYQEDVAQARCDLYERCELLEDPFGYESTEDCRQEWALKVAEDQEEGLICQDYDAQAARECVEGLEAVSCEQVAEDYPSSCSEVCSES